MRWCPALLALLVLEAMEGGREFWLQGGGQEAASWRRGPRGGSPLAPHLRGDGETWRVWESVSPSDGR